MSEIVIKSLMNNAFKDLGENRENRNRAIIVTHPGGTQI